MIAYIFFKESKMIICKINNVNSIDINGREIIGDSTIRFGESQDFVILQSDTINKNIGEEISLDGLEDERSYFTKGKEVWMQEKINKLNNTNTALNDRIKTLETIPNLPTRVESNEGSLTMNEDTINYILTDILPSLMV